VRRRAEGISRTTPATTVQIDPSFQAKAKPANVSQTTRREHPAALACNQTLIRA
jgi:hypothetical protein